MYTITVYRFKNIRTYIRKTTQKQIWDGGCLWIMWLISNYSSFVSSFRKAVPFLELLELLFSFSSFSVTHFILVSQHGQISHSNFGMKLVQSKRVEDTIPLDTLEWNSNQNFCPNSHGSCPSLILLAHLKQNQTCCVSWHFFLSFFE